MPPEHFTTDRQYLHVQPSTDPLQPTDVARSITRLHHTTSGDQPTYEWLFVATGDTGPTGDRHIDWYVGSDDRQPVKRTLRQSLPSSVDLVETTTSYQRALNLDDGPTEPSPDDDAADFAVAGVEWQGVGDRPDGWQTPLSALESFAGEHEGDWPLADLLDALATGLRDASFGRTVTNEYGSDEPVTLVAQRPGSTRRAVAVGERVRSERDEWGIPMVDTTAARFDDAVAVFEQDAAHSLRFTDAMAVAQRGVDAVLRFDDDFDGVIEQVEPADIVERSETTE